MKPRDFLTALAVVCLSSALFWTPALDRLEGISIDSLYWLRAKLLPPREVPGSPAVVIRYHRYCAHQDDSLTERQYFTDCEVLHRTPAIIEG